MRTLCIKSCLAISIALQTAPICSAEESTATPPAKPKVNASAPKPLGNVLQRMTVTLGQKSTSDAFCQKVTEALKFHIEALKRYDLVSEGPPQHTIVLNCDERMVQGNWGIYVKSSKKKKANKALKKVLESRIAIGQELQGNESAVALRLLRDFQGKLPWDSEVPVFDIVEDKNGKEKSRDQLGVNFVFGPHSSSSQYHIIASSANGTEASPLLANCLAVELGDIRWDQKEEKVFFRHVGFGIINLASNYGSKIEGYVPASQASSLIENENMFYRFTDENQADRKTRLLVKRCKSKMGELENSTLDKLLSGDGSVFSAESIELNSVDQRVGLAAFGLNSTNGQRVPTTMGGYVHNTIGIGDLLGIDIRGFSHITAHAYSPGIDDYTDKARVSVGEFYGLLRLNLDAIDLDLGLGEVIDGVNVLYYIDEDNVGNRKPVSRIAGMFRTGAMWDAYFFNLRVGYSFSAVGRFISFSLDNNLKLSKTWYMGSDISYSAYGATLRGEPGYSLYSAGIHLGFFLERVKR